MPLFLITLAQAGGDNGAGGGGMQLIIMLPAFILVFYFLLIRPQRQKDKERREMLDKVKKGDKIITTGGILGEVVRVGEREIVILVDKEKNARLRLLRTAIYGITESREGEGGKSTEGTADTSG